MATGENTRSDIKSVWISKEDYESLNSGVAYHLFCKPCMHLCASKKEWFQHMQEEEHQNTLLHLGWWRSMNVIQEKNRMLVVFCSAPVTSLITDMLEYFDCLDGVVSDLYWNKEKPGIAVFLFHDEDNAKKIMVEHRKFEQNLTVNLRGKNLQIVPFEDLLISEWTVWLNCRPVCAHRIRPCSPVQEFKDKKPSSDLTLLGTLSEIAGTELKALRKDEEDKLKKAIQGCVNKDGVFRMPTLERNKKQKS